MKPLRQFWALAHFWIAVALRLRVGWAIGFGAVALVAGGALLRELHFGSAEAGFLVDYVGAVFALGGSVLIALAGPTVFFEGLRTRTTAVLLAHRASRGAVLGAQLAAIIVLLGWLLAAVVAATVGLFSAVGHGSCLADAVRILAQTVGPLIALAAASVLFASLARHALLASALTLAMALAGHLAPVIAHAGVQATGASRAGWVLLAWLVPNFAVAERASTAVALGYFSAYAAIYVAMAVWVFSRREL